MWTRYPKKCVARIDEQSTFTDSAMVLTGFGVAPNNLDLEFDVSTGNARRQTVTASGFMRAEPCRVHLECWTRGI